MILTCLSGARRLLLFGAALVGSAAASGCGTDKIVGPASVASVSVAIASPTLIAYPRAGAAGSTTQATATAKDANGHVLAGRPIAWSTDNATVAIVSVEGVVAAVGLGNATITATSEGKTGSATVTVSAPVPQVRQRSLALGSYHSCAIAVDGNTYCWGAGYNGQLGSLRMSTEAPRLVNGDHKFSAISTSYNTSYGLKADGALYCWGGEPCDPTAGNTIDEHAGPAVPDAKRMSTSRTIETLGSGSPIGGNYVPMCAIGVGNVAYCWGKNTNGELGIGWNASNETVLAPDRAVIGNYAFADVAAGLTHACAITTTGSAYCWGAGTYGALGDGSGTKTAEPAAVAGSHTFKMIGVGSFFSCGLTTDGRVYCWGGNDLAQLGTPTGNCLGGMFPCSATPIAVSGGHVFESIAVGHNRACGVIATGDIYCWGLGFGATPRQFRSVLADESGGVRFRIVALGFVHICAVSTAGDAWCRGGNHLGQLGNGGYGPTDEPGMVIGGIKFRTP